MVCKYHQRNALNYKSTLAAPSSGFVGSQPEQWVWRPTDLYAPPGQVVTVGVPPHMVEKIDVTKNHKLNHVFM